MWRYALFGGPALLVVGSDVKLHHRRDLNSSSSVALLTSSHAPSFPSPYNPSDHKDASSSTPSLSSLSTSFGPLRFTFAPSGASPPVPDPTSLVSTSSTVANSSTVHGPCTGCVIQAYNPVTTFFDKDDMYNPWTSVVVTETVVTQIITYFDGSTIDTVVTEQQTVNQTKTIVGEGNETITHTTPTFIVEPTPGVYLTLEAGPTFVIYDNLVGGLDEYVDSTYAALELTLQTCVPTPTTLENWEPTATEDWSYFIQTYTEEPQNQVTDWPVPLPSKLIDFLKQDPDIVSQYRGSDIATCTVRAPQGIDLTPGAPERTMSKPAYSPAIPSEAPSTETGTEPATAPFESVTTGTFISTTYESTSTHVTRQGCLRCENTAKPHDDTKPSEGPISNKIIDPVPSPTYKPNDPNKPDQNPQPNASSKPEDNKPTPNNLHTPPSIPDVIVSIIHNNPSIWTQNPPVTTAGQIVTIANNVYPIYTAKPTQNKPDQPNEQNQAPPVIVIGSETLYPGQTKTINGVPVVAPTGGGGSRLVVDGSTMTVSPAGATGAPILTIGSNTVTADAQGQYVVGSATLKPGGPAVTVDGSTYSLGTSATILVVNDVPSTLGNAQAITAAPALTIDGKPYAATVRDGTTEYVLGQGTTLTPGAAVTLSGTTYSLDPKGTALVVNGQTSSIHTVPASNSASTTAHASSGSRSSSAERSGTTGGTTSGTTSGRGAGDLIASGIGESSRGAGISRYGRGLDTWIEGLVTGAAGWLLFML